MDTKHRRNNVNEKNKDEAMPKVNGVTYSPEQVLKMLGWENVDWAEVVRDMHSPQGRPLPCKE